VLYGPHIHAPLVGAGITTMSDCQQARVQFSPSLCPALRDRARALTSCTTSQPTQCINTADRHKLKALFPISYGSPLVSIDAGAAAEEQEQEQEEEEDTGGDYVQRKRRRTALAREPSAALTVGVCFCGRQAPGGHDIIAGEKHSQ
jgi:hypothetical protein